MVRQIVRTVSLDGDVQVVGAIGVVLVIWDTKLAVPGFVACRHQCVVDAGRGVVSELQDWSPVVVDQRVAGER